MSLLVPAGFVLLALVHLAPALPALSARRLQALYGVDPADTSLRLLLQHRALLFAILAGACVAAARLPHLRGAVLVGAGVSMAGFLVQYGRAGAPAGPLRRVAVVDGVGVAVWVGTALARLYST